MHGTIGTMKGCGIRPTINLVKNARCEEFLRRSDASSWFLRPRQSEWERQLFSVLAVLGRVGLRGTRTLLSTTMTVTSKRTREDPVAEGLCWVKCPAIR